MSNQGRVLAFSLLFVGLLLEGGLRLAAGIMLKGRGQTYHAEFGWQRDALSTMAPPQGADFRKLVRANGARLQLGNLQNKRIWR